MVAVAWHWLNSGCPQLDVNTTMQTTMKKIISLVLCGIILSSAQSTIAAESTGSGLTISAEAGTTGLGGSANWRFSDHLGVRAGAHFFEHKFDEFTYTAEPDGITPADQKFDVTLRLLSAPIGVDIYPWANSTFRIGVGVLVNQNEFTATAKSSATPGANFVFNGNDYLQSQVGDVNLKVEQQVISPYLSIGGSVFLGNEKKWALHGELGVAYTGSPKVSLEAPNRNPILDGPFSTFGDDLNAEEQKIEKDAEDYQFYPIVKIGVSFSF